MNIVLEGEATSKALLESIVSHGFNFSFSETLEISNSNEATEIGTIVVRGNSIISMEALEPVASSN